MSRTGSCSALGDVANFVATLGRRNRSDLDDSAAAKEQAPPTEKLHTHRATIADTRHTHAETDNTTRISTKMRQVVQRSAYYSSPCSQQGVDCPSARCRSTGVLRKPACNTGSGFPTYQGQTRHGLTAEDRYSNTLPPVFPRARAEPGRWSLAQVSRRHAWRPHAQGRSFTKDPVAVGEPANAANARQTCRDRAMDRLDHRVGRRSLARRRPPPAQAPRSNRLYGRQKCSARPRRLSREHSLVANRSREEAPTTTTPFGPGAGSVSKSGLSATRMQSVRKRLHGGLFLVSWSPRPSYGGAPARRFLGIPRSTMAGQRVVVRTRARREARCAEGLVTTYAFVLDPRVCVMVAVSTRCLAAKSRRMHSVLGTTLDVAQR